MSAERDYDRLMAEQDRKSAGAYVRPAFFARLADQFIRHHLERNRRGYLTRRAKRADGSDYSLEILAHDVLVRQCEDGGDGGLHSMVRAMNETEDTPAGFKMNLAVVKRLDELYLFDRFANQVRGGDWDAAFLLTNIYLYGHERISDWIRENLKIKLHLTVMSDILAMAQVDNLRRSVVDRLLTIHREDAFWPDVYGDDWTAIKTESNDMPHRLTDSWEHVVDREDKAAEADKDE